MEDEFRSNNIPLYNCAMEATKQSKITAITAARATKLSAGVTEPLRYSNKRGDTDILGNVSFNYPNCELRTHAKCFNGELHIKPSIYVRNVPISSRISGINLDEAVRKFDTKFYTVGAVLHLCAQCNSRSLAVSLTIVPQTT